MEFQLKKGYRPYEAYQYLEPGRDFKVIDWADWDWAGRNILPLDPEEEIRCRELLERTPYVSLHDHPDFTTRDREQSPEAKKRRRKPPTRTKAP